MAEVAVYTTKFPGKKGDPIYHASFFQLVKRPDSKQEDEVPLRVSGGDYGNIYQVSLLNGIFYGKVRVKAPGRGTSDIDPFYETRSYTVLI